MTLERTTASLLALLPLATASPVFALQTGADDTDARTRIEALVEPPRSAQDDEAEQEKVYAAVKRILGGSAPEAKRVAIFGDRGVRALRVLIEESDLETLSAVQTYNPVHVLHRFFPEGMIDLLLDEERDDPAFFDMLVRSHYGPAELTMRKGLREPARAKLAGLIDRTVERESLPLEDRILTAVSARRSGHPTAGSDAFLTARLALVTSGFEDEAQSSLVPLITARYGGDLASAPAEIAHYMIKHAMTSEVYRSLATSADPDVRQRLAGALHTALERRRMRADDASSILLELCDDPSPTVLTSVVHSLAFAVEDDRSFLTLAELRDAIAGLRNAPPMEDRQAKAIANAVLFRLSSIAEDEQRLAEEVFELMFGGPQSKLGAAVTTQIQYHRLPLPAVIALVSTTSRTGGLSTSRAQAIASQSTPSTRIEQSTFLMRLFTSIEPDSALADALAGYEVRWLPPSMASAALEWLGRTGERYDEPAATSVCNWVGAEDALRASAYDSARAPRERALAALGLRQSPETRDADVPRMVAAFRELLTTDDGRAQVTRLVPHAFREGGGVDRSPHWHAVLARLAEDPQVPSAELSKLSLNRPAATEEQVTAVAAVVDAMHERWRQDPDAMNTKNIAYYTLDTANDRSFALDPLEGHEDLVLEWARSTSFDTRCVTYSLVRAPKLQGQLLTNLIEQLLREDFIGRQKPIVDQILRIPLDDAVPQLLATTRTIGAPDLVNYVDGRVGELLRIREIEQRWGRVGTLSASVEDTTAAVVRLLDHHDEAVRVEAIRGLGTLGATAMLPRLIELVGTGTEKEKAAARETLDLLHRRAARELAESEAD